MAEVIIPCYGGPYDGAFYPEKRAPSGYKLFLIRGRNIYLWKPLKVERLDFNILSKASKSLPSSFDLQDPTEEKDGK